MCHSSFDPLQTRNDNANDVDSDIELILSLVQSVSSEKGKQRIFSDTRMQGRLFDATEAAQMEERMIMSIVRNAAPYFVRGRLYSLFDTF
jgi:uncharacterized caspase-like protein